MQKEAENAEKNHCLGFGPLGMTRWVHLLCCVNRNLAGWREHNIDTGPLQKRGHYVCVWIIGGCVGLTVPRPGQLRSYSTKQKKCPLTTKENKSLCLNVTVWIVKYLVKEQLKTCIHKMFTKPFTDFNTPYSKDTFQSILEKFIKVWYTTGFLTGSCLINNAAFRPKVCSVLDISECCAHLECLFS